jgi:hypothetical protein
MYRKNLFMTMMENYNEILKNNESAINSDGVALQKQGIHMDSLQAHTNNLVNALQRVYLAVTNSDGLKKFLDIATEEINVFAKLSEKIGTIPMAIGVITLAVSAFSKKFREEIMSNIVSVEILRTKIKENGVQTGSLINGNFLSVNIPIFDKLIAKIKETKIANQELGMSFRFGLFQENIFAIFTTLQNSLTAYINKLQIAIGEQMALGQTGGVATLTASLKVLKAGIDGVIKSEIAMNAMTVVLQATMTVGLSVILGLLIVKLT